MTASDATVPLHSGRVAIVEDDLDLRRLLAEEIEGLGCEVRLAGSAEEASGLMASWLPDLVLSDLRLPGSDGLQLLRHTRGLSRVPSFIMITAFGTVSQAVSALRHGADDFLIKPLDLEHLSLAVTRAFDQRRLRDELRRYRALAGEEDGFHGMIGRSRPMQRLCAEITQVARATGPVLVVGESGVGKELVARAVHHESGVKGPCLAVNCAGIPGELIESELFGHTVGAFTGASRARKGLFTEAHGGTLLLDEVGDLPLAMQSKLLRVLQEGVVRPVGADVEHPVDVRIVAATNRDLEVALAGGAFREDLFYRLDTFTIEVPPLRERGADVELLAARFVHTFAGRLGKHITGLTADALECLRTYSFPGNVRELQHAIERAVAFCHGPTIGVEHLPARLRDGGSTVERAQTAPLAHLLGDDALPTMAELEVRYADYVLARMQGNKRRAAAVLGIGRGTLYRRLGRREGGDV